MEFAWSTEQLALKRATHDFACRELDAGRGEVREDGAAWGACARYGILGLPFPEAYGGGEQDALTAALVLESLGRGCRDNGLLFALGAQMWSVQMPLLVHGTEEQRRQYLPRLIGGEIVGAHAATEPEAGSDVFALRTSARREGNVYVLNGAKTFITSAPSADLFLVLATIDRSRGPAGVTAFLLERGTPGLSTSRPMPAMGLHSAELGEVFLDNCPVPAAGVLGREGGGAAVFKTAMEWERLLLLAPALGAMERQLELCRRHARQRRQFGRPIGANQAVAGKLVDMHARLEHARWALYRAAWLKATDEVVTWEPSWVKLTVSENWVANCLDAIQIFGGAGYAVETGVERDLRDAIGSRIYSGTSEIQRQIIASLLGVG